MITWKIPTLEQIYNEYHKQTFFVRNGVYPKTIQNYESLYQDQRKIEQLKYFVEFIKRNRASVDWKIYILALAKVLKTRYDLKYLGSFSGNKIYRDYVKSLYSQKDNINDIYDEIINSLVFLTNFLKDMFVKGSFLNIDLISVVLALVLECFVLSPDVANKILPFELKRIEGMKKFILISLGLMMILLLFNMII